MSLRDQLLAIREEHGYLNPEVLVSAARPVDHPLHSMVFDKDVPEAAEAYYRARAHQLIRSVRIVAVEPSETDPGIDVRAFHAVRTSDDRQYVYEPVEAIAADPLLAELALRDAERRWKELHRQYGHLKEFLEMVLSDAIEQAA